jgi:DNA mismatch repair protein MutS
VSRGGRASAGRRPLGAPDRCGAIEARLDLVGWLVGDALLREDLRRILRALPDVGRALGRVVAGRGSPRDLGQLRDGLLGADALARHLAQQPLRPVLADTLLPRLVGHDDLIASGRVLVQAPPTERGQGGYIAEGYDPSLDQLRRTAKDGRVAVAALEAKYREETGIATLKIKHNGVLGYFIEVPAGRADALMAPDRPSPTARRWRGDALQRAGPA